MEQSARRDPVWAYEPASELQEPRALSAFVYDRCSFASPISRRIGACPTGQLNRRFERVRVRSRAVDHILLVYYCGHTGQRSLLGGPPSRVSPCVLPGSIQVPWARRGHPAPQLGRALGGWGGKGRAPWRRHSYRRATRDPAPRWGHGERREARKGLYPLESEGLERPGLPMAGTRARC
jgi:hypothetical protein